jgi:hypothetical protein
VRLRKKEVLDFFLNVLVYGGKRIYLRSGEGTGNLSVIGVDVEYVEG